MKNYYLILSTFIHSTFIACTPQSEEDRFIESLLSRMTIEEKIGQMNQLQRLPSCQILLHSDISTSSPLPHSANATYIQQHLRH